MWYNLEKFPWLLWRVRYWSPVLTCLLSIPKSTNYPAPWMNKSKLFKPRYNLPLATMCNNTHVSHKSIWIPYKIWAKQFTNINNAIKIGLLEKLFVIQIYIHSAHFEVALCKHTLCYIWRRNLYLLLESQYCLQTCHWKKNIHYTQTM